MSLPFLKTSQENSALEDDPGIDALTILDEFADTDCWFDAPVSGLNIWHTELASENPLEQSRTHQKYLKRQDIVLFKRCSRIAVNFPHPIKAEVLKSQLTAFKQRNPAARIGSDRTFHAWASAAAWHYHRSKKLPCAIYQYASVADMTSSQFLNRFISSWAKVMQVDFTFSTVKELALSHLDRMESMPEALRLSDSYQPQYKFRRKRLRESDRNSPMNATGTSRALKNRRKEECSADAFEDLFKIEVDRAVATIPKEAGDDELWKAPTSPTLDPDSEVGLMTIQDASSGSTVDELFGDLKSASPNLTDADDLGDMNPSQKRQIFALWRKEVLSLASSMPELCENREPFAASLPLGLVILAVRRSHSIPKTLAKLSVWSSFFGLTAQSVHASLTGLARSASKKLNNY